MQTAHSNVIALDVGDKRIGVAIANNIARLPRPLMTINNDEHVFDRIKDLLAEEQANCVVVGLPRGLEGQETQQTASTREFAAKLEQAIGIEINFQDEALTSHQAERELAKAGKIYDKGAVDALAATYILEDYINSQLAHSGDQE